MSTEHEVEITKLQLTENARQFDANLAWQKELFLLEDKRIRDISSAQLTEGIRQFDNR